MQKYSLANYSIEDKEKRREELIKSEENFILRTASITSKKFITKSDDEWSIALCAFSEALDTYSENKGEFRAYAKLLIKRSLIDYFRSQKQYNNEIAISFQTLENNTNTNTEEDGSPVMESLQILLKTPLQEEIESLTEELKVFEISFMGLADCSPKQNKTREECKKAVNYVLSDEEVFDRIITTKQLPVSELVSETGVSRKTLDRYRKYIIMAVLVLHNGYPELSEYLKFMKGGQ